MKLYIFFFLNAQKNNQFDKYEVKTDMGFKSALAHFCNAISPANSIQTIHTQELDKDSLIDFLDNNPPKEEYRPTTFEGLTDDQKHAYYMGYNDAENHFQYEETKLAKGW